MATPFERGLSRIRGGASNLLENHFRLPSTALHADFVDACEDYLVERCFPRLHSSSSSALAKEIRSLVETLKRLLRALNHRTVELHGVLSPQGQGMVGAAIRVCSQLLKEVLQSMPAAAPSKGGKPTDVGRNEFLDRLTDIFTGATGAKPKAPNVDRIEHTSYGPFLDFAVDAFNLVSPPGRGAKRTEAIASAIKRRLKRAKPASQE